MHINDFLPMNKYEMRKYGWEAVDFVVVTGDAYVDHPSFGAAVIARVLVNAGFRVGIISQPDWRTDKDFRAFDAPRLGYLVTSGNIDSMVNHYTVAKKRRTDDAFSPGGQAGLRPDRALLVYVNKLKELYKKTPVIIGGVEASLRRLAHYDYWDDKVRRSILADSDADLLVYGMAEYQIIEIAQFLQAGIDIKYLHHLPGTCFLTDDPEEIEDVVILPDADTVASDKKKYAEAFARYEREQNPILGKPLAQKNGFRYVVQMPPALPLDRPSLDAVYALPYQRAPHPYYRDRGGVPAIKEVRHSIIGQRGCFGGCSFCALTFHQGRIVTSRSEASVVEEAVRITEDPTFKGYINDIGGPTANFRNAACDRQKYHGACQHRQCLFPEPCPELKVDHGELLSILRKVRNLKGVKKVFLRSGIRYDYLMMDQDPTFFEELVTHHVSGQLKVAPEHIDDGVLAKMGKPGRDVYDGFCQTFFDLTKQAGKEQYLVPYLMSSHPGSTLESAIALAEYLRDIDYQPQQVQDFYPTPGTASTTMYYTGLDPRTMEPVYVAKNPREKRTQRALLQYKNPKNYTIVLRALRDAGRDDLIGFGPQCLIRPPGKKR